MKEASRNRLAHPGQHTASSLRRLANPFTTIADIQMIAHLTSFPNTSFREDVVAAASDTVNVANFWAPRI